MTAGFSLIFAVICIGGALSIVGIVCGVAQCVRHCRRILQVHRTQQMIDARWTQYVKPINQ